MEQSNTKSSETTTSYIVDFDDFCEGNTRLKELLLVKAEVPSFKVNLFTIPGKCSKGFLKEMEKYDWIDLIPHGFMHPTPREAENWTYEEAFWYLEDFMYRGFTKGFKAPGWQISTPTYQALLDLGYWVADQSYNNERRPKELKAYILDSGNKIHGHIGHMGGHNTNEIEYLMPHLLALKGMEFSFIKDIV